MAAALVILWWGADIRFQDGSGRTAGRTLEEKEDPVPAILQMAGREFPAARTVRIIYHPDTLAVHEVPCPHASRSRLRRIFTGEFRALDAPDAVWSVEPVRQGLNGYGTVLYIDRDSRLPRLLDRLSERGLSIEGVWPLQSLIEATPPCDAREGGFLALAATGNRALVSCLGLSGDRAVRFCDGREFAEAAITEMRTALARFEEGAMPTPLMILEDGPQAGALREAMAAMAPVSVPLAAFLAQARLLPAGGFSDFIPRKSLWARRLDPRRMAAVIGLVLLAGAAGFAGITREDREHRQRQIDAWREQRAHLQQVLAGRAAIQGEIDRLTLALARVQTPPQPHFEFLLALARATPKAVTLQAVDIENGFFTVVGRIDEGSGRLDNPLAVFCRELAAADAPWRLPDAPPKMDGADFVLRGSFAPR